MVASLAFLTIPVLLSATSPGLAVLIGWRFVQGLLMPGIIAVTIAYINEEWSAGGAASVMSAYVAGNVFSAGFQVALSVGVDRRSLRLAMGVRCAGRAKRHGGSGGVALAPRIAPHHVRGTHGDFRSSLRAMAGHFRQPTSLATFLIGTGTLFALVATFTYITFYLAAPPFHLGTSEASAHSSWLYAWSA